MVFLTDFCEHCDADTSPAASLVAVAGTAMSVETDASLLDGEVTEVCAAITLVSVVSCHGLTCVVPGYLGAAAAGCVKQRG